VKLREWANRNPVLTTIGALVLFSFALGVVIYQTTGAPSSEVQYRYFYDLNERTIFIANQQTAPVAAPSGPTGNGEKAGVFAWIYSCGQCRGSYAGQTTKQIRQHDAKLVYLERQRRETGQGAPADRDVTMVAPPDAKQWVPIMSAQGNQLTSAFPDCDGDQKLRVCHPSQ
jgi:hypothetical protein